MNDNNDSISESQLLDDSAEISETSSEQPEPTLAIDSTEETISNTEPTLAVDSTEETTSNTDESNPMVDQVGHLTRTLHNSLRELGYDTRLKEITSEVPETQDRLSYVATKAEQAAERVLTATEIAMPIQDKLSTDAIHLSEQWKQALEANQSSPPDPDKFKDLLIETLTYLDKVPSQSKDTNAQLMEIMMAQDFQDLTGQVMKKITKMVQDLEKELLQLLVEHVPKEKREAIINNDLMNGPIVNPEETTGAVTDQGQVDDLLASMGF